MTRLESPLVVGGCIAILLSVTLGDASAAIAQSPPANDELRHALQAWQEGAIDIAHQHLEAALRSDQNDSSTLVTIYRHLAVSRELLGDPDGARQAIEFALALDPATTPVAESGPAQRALFDQIRVLRGARPLGIRFEVLGDVSARARTRIAINAEGAPVGLVSSIEVRTIVDGSEPWTGAISGVAGEVEIPSSAWPEGDELQLEVQLRDAHGAGLRVRRETLRWTPPSETTEDLEDREGNGILDPPPPPPEERSVWRSPWLWTGVGAVIAGGVVAAVLLSNGGGQTLYGDPSVVAPSMGSSP